MAAPFRVEGKSAIVTGAGSGINYAFASLLLSRGCNVLLADLSLRPEAQALVEKYSSSSTSPSSSGSVARAVYQRTDVSSWADLSAMFDRGIAEFGSIDIVCPGAGIYDPHWSNFWHPPELSTSTTTTTTATEEEEEKEKEKKTNPSRDSIQQSRYASLDINITHPIRTSQLAISHFLSPPSSPSSSSPPPARVHPATNPKRILLISSIAGQLPNFHTPLYVASKHAITGFIRSLAPLEARFGIRVNGVAPGVIKTPLWTDHPEKLKYVDQGRDEWASAEEVAVAMVRCLEEEELVGGTVLEVGKDQTRKVGILNDPGPSGKGHTVSNLTAEYEEVYGWLEEEGWGMEKKP